MVKGDIYAPRRYKCFAHIQSESVYYKLRASAFISSSRRANGSNIVREPRATDLCNLRHRSKVVVGEQRLFCRPMRNLLSTAFFAIISQHIKPFMSQSYKIIIKRLTGLTKVENNVHGANKHRRRRLIFPN